MPADLTVPMTTMTEYQRLALRGEVPIDLSTSLTFQARGWLDSAGNWTKVGEQMVMEARRG